MTNSSLKSPTTIANSCAAIVGAVLLSFASELEGQVQSYLMYLVPALTMALGYFFNVIASMATQSVSGMLLDRSTQKTLKRLEAQYNNPILDDDAKQEIKAQIKQLYAIESQALMDRHRIIAKAFHSSLANSKKANAGLTPAQQQQLTKNAEELSSPQTQTDSDTPSKA